MKDQRKKYRNLRLFAGISLVILALLIANVPSPFRADELTNTMGLPDGTEGVTETESEGASETETLSSETETENASETETETETESETETETEESRRTDYDTRAITVADHRKDTEKGGKTTASVPKTYSKTVFLRIESSEGNQIKSLINEKYGYDAISYFTMILATEDSGGTVVSDFGERCTVTIVPPEEFSVSNKETVLYGMDNDGTLEKIYTVEAETTSGETYLMFSTDRMGEYAFVLNEKEKTKLPIEDQRDDKTGTVTSSIIWETAEVEGTTLIIEDNEGIDEKNTNLIPLLEETEEYQGALQTSYYDLSLQDGEDQMISADSSFRVYVHLPLPRNMNAAEGEVAAVYTYVSLVDGKKKAEKAEIVDTGTENGISYVDFIATHFSEYSVLFRAKTEADEQIQNAAPSPTQAAASDPATAATGASETAPQASTQALETASQSSTGASAPAGNTAAEAAPSQASAPAAEAAPAAAPASSERPAQAAGAAASAQSSQTSGQGKVDMPKTADETTYRNILVILFLVAGCILLVTCLPIKGKKERQ